MRIIFFGFVLASFVLVGCVRDNNTSTNHFAPAHSVEDECTFDVYYTKLQSKNSVAFEACYAIQDDFVDCVGATVEQGDTCATGASDDFNLCVNLAESVRGGCYADVARDPSVIACQESHSHNGTSDAACGAALRGRCDKAFSLEEELCLNDADYAEQDCLTEITGEDASDPGILECFDDVIFERDGCWKEESLAFDDSCY
jgi:hypothetical protein